MKKDVFPHLEWEVMREPIVISDVVETPQLPEGDKKITVKRDEYYHLHGLLNFKGAFKNLFMEGEREPPPGSFINRFNIKGSAMSSGHIILQSCHIGSRRTRYEEGEQICEVDLDINALRVKFKAYMEGVWLSEWYLNGFQNHIFWNLTRRKISETYLRERKEPGLEGETLDRLELPAQSDGREYSARSESFACDFLKIKTSNLQFIVTQIPQGIGPDWSLNVGIEYRSNWGYIPNSDEREKISELCSFILGRHLLLVGYTLYDKDGNLVEAYACNPWNADPRLACSDKKFLPPIRIDNPPSGKAELTISQLLPEYYRLRSHLNLHEALWLYWIARDVPAGTDLPIFAAAVETIKKAWFKSKKTASSGIYIGKEEFEMLLSSEIEAIKSKLKGKPNCDKILSKIYRAYEMGVGEGLREFFKEIDLRLETHEWDAINARHIVAHGGLEFDETDWKKLVQYRWTYETILNKIILKLLGYSGSYIDRSIIGWKEKQLI